MSSRGCVNSPNCFCYICGEFMIKKHQRNIKGFIIKLYYTYFGVKMGYQDKSCAPHKVCYVCVEDLRNWSKLKQTQNACRFGVPLIWKEPKSHSDNCYFCCCYVKGYNSKNKKAILYPKLHSALRHIVHGPVVLVPQPTEIFEDASTNRGDNEEFQCQSESQSPQMFTRLN
jgi:hypothetical protein